MGEEEETLGEYFKCSECNYSAKTKELLRRHVSYKHGGLASDIVGQEEVKADGSKVVYFHCPDCKFRTKRKSVLTMHIDDKHINPFQHVCDSCGKSFAQKKCLQEHVKRIHLDEKVSCDVCGLRDANVHLIRIHKMLKHEGYVQVRKPSKK